MLSQACAEQEVCHVGGVGTSLELSPCLACFGRNKAKQLLFRNVDVKLFAGNLISKLLQPSLSFIDPLNLSFPARDFSLNGLGFNVSPYRNQFLQLIFAEMIALDAVRERIMTLREKFLLLQ